MRQPIGDGAQFIQHRFHPRQHDVEGLAHGIKGIGGRTGRQIDPGVQFAGGDFAHHIGNAARPIGDYGDHQLAGEPGQQRRHGQRHGQQRGERGLQLHFGFQAAADQQAIAIGHGPCRHHIGFDVAMFVVHSGHAVIAPVAGNARRPARQIAKQQAAIAGGEVDDERARHRQFAIENGDGSLDAIAAPGPFGRLGNGGDAGLRFAVELGLGGTFQQDQQQRRSGQDDQEQHQADPRRGGARRQPAQQQAEA